MSRSLTRAWAPVPLKGQSSRITPRFASTSRAASLTGIGSVLVSITIAPRPADCVSSAAVRARASADGSEVMMMSARRATSRGLRAAIPPERACSARRRGTNSTSPLFRDRSSPPFAASSLPLFLLVRRQIRYHSRSKKGGGVAGPVSNLLVGVDIGGTFTDCVVLDRAGRITATKAPSTPGNFAEGMLAAMGVAAERLGLSFEKFCGEIAVLTHGTTVGTNALIPRKGAKAGLVTTRRHDDAIHIT